MFGYVRPYKPEMKIKDYSVYKAVYCGLCNTLGKRYGFLGRMILSYDAAFLCLLSMSLTDGCDGFEKKRCPVKPHKKCDAARGGPTIDYWADMSVLLTYHKLRDNRKDSGFFKKAAAAAALPFLKPAYKKAARNNPFAAQCVTDYIAAQSEIESKGVLSPDAAAQPTARLMESLLEHSAKDDTQKRILARIGFFLGRWIYFADAADDYDDDRKSGDYNPFAAQDRDEATETAKRLLNSCVCEIDACFGLLEIRRYRDIVANVFFLGLAQMKNALLSGLDKKERKKRFDSIYRI